MPASEVHLSDIGTSFIVTVKDGSTAVDISSASTKQYIFQKPSGENLTVSASFYTDGTDGILSYSTVDGDLDEIGIWKLQVYLVIGSNSWHSDIVDFRVHRNL